MKLRGEARLCIRCGAPGCSTRFQCKQGFYCGAACRSADQKMQETKKTPSKCFVPEKPVEAGGWGKVAGTVGTKFTGTNVDDANSKQWQDTRTLVDEMKQLLKLDNSQVAQRSGTSSLHFESWYNKPLECTPAFMDDITKNLGLWIEKERDCGLQQDDKSRSDEAGASPTPKVRKYGKSQRALKDDAAAQNELPSGSFQKTWEDETALERIRRNQVGKKPRLLTHEKVSAIAAAFGKNLEEIYGTPRLAQSSGSGPGGSSRSDSIKVAFPLADSSTASIKRLTEAQPSRSDGSRDFRSKEQTKSKLTDDAVELALLPSTSESNYEWDELDVASVLAFCTAAELAEATNQQNSEALARLVLGRMPVSSQTTAKMRGDTLGRELLRMGRVTRWLSGAIDIVYEVMCEAMRSPESDLAASLEQVGAHGTSAPKVLEDFAKSSRRKES